MTFTRAFADPYGTGSDAELLAGCSLYLLETGAVFTERYDVDFRCLPELLREAGYHTVAMHANWPNFWNRDRMYPAMGYAVLQHPRLRPDPRGSGWPLRRSLRRAGGGAARFAAGAVLRGARDAFEPRAVRRPEPPAHAPARRARGDRGGRLPELGAVHRCRARRPRGSPARERSTSIGPCSSSTAITTASPDGAGDRPARAARAARRRVAPARGAGAAAGASPAGVTRACATTRRARSTSRRRSPICSAYRPGGPSSTDAASSPARRVRWCPGRLGGVGGAGAARQGGALGATGLLDAATAHPWRGAPRRPRRIRRARARHLAGGGGPGSLPLDALARGERRSRRRGISRTEAAVKINRRSSHITEGGARRTARCSTGSGTRRPTS